MSKGIRKIHRYLRILRKYAGAKECDGNCGGKLGFDRCSECVAKVSLEVLQKELKDAVKFIRKQECESDATKDK